MTVNGPPFVITGCARSGTGYMADLLTKLGHPCEHETVFTPYADRFPGFGTVRGDSSWLAAPFVDQLPAGTVVLHQVRHPDLVVDSLAGIRFFDTRGTAVGRDAGSLIQVVRSRGARGLLGGIGRRFTRGRRLRRDFVAFARAHCPEIFDEPDERSRAARYWVNWNRLAQRAAGLEGLVYRQYRLEDVDEDLLADVVGLLGGGADRVRIADAVAQVPTTTNTRPRRGDRTPTGLDEELADEVACLAREYGYDT